MTPTELLEMATRATRANLDLVATVSAGDLALPTPCSAWNLGDLLAHMTGQNRGLSSAAKGWGAGATAAWEPVAVSPAAPSEAYEASVDAVLYAMVVAIQLDRGIRIPEIDPDRDFSAASAVSFYLVDTLAHGWDIARTLDLTFEVDEEVVAVATQVAAMIPDDAARREPSALFAPRLPSTDGDPMGHFLRLLGRDPAWSATGAAETVVAVRS
jgi:uncharacterized protein (TIGR03086 family)